MTKQANCYADDRGCKEIKEKTDQRREQDHKKQRKSRQPITPLKQRPRQKNLKRKAVALLKKKDRRTKGQEQRIGNGGQI